MILPNETIPAKAIWLNADNNKDEYADFYPDVRFFEGKKYVLRIVCDTEKAVYLDGQLIYFGQYADYPSTPVYDDIAFSANENSVLKISAWHSGIHSQTHIATQAYVAFCIYENGKLIYSSSEATLSRPTPEYIPHRCAIITSQMGCGFALDGKAKPEALHASCRKDIVIDSLRQRPIKPLFFGETVTGKVVREGMFRLCTGDDTAMVMKNAELDVTDNASGVYYLFDLGAECVGFPEISFSSGRECKVMIGWGEHIADGMCRTAIHTRRFTIEINAKSGDNYYFPVLRRLGLRYLQMFFTTTEIEDVSFKLRPVLLAVDEKPLDLNNELRNKIRATAIHTLRCCMHEHYEDCPWREQALYTLDSRNQMLAGYEVFADKNKEFARANLDLISRGVRQDGILSLCYPAGIDAPIPFYTLAYFTQMWEYIENTGDTSLAIEKLDILRSLLDTFYNAPTKNGLVRRFPDSEGYWNFYEWSAHLSGDRIYKSSSPDELPYEAILNAALSMASDYMAKICAALGRADEAVLYSSKARAIAKSVAETFYHKETELFYDFTDRSDLQPSVLTQAMCVLCGASEGLPREKMLKAIAENGGNNIVPATLSMACFRYDALLRADKNKYTNPILEEIDRDGKFMLDRGATTFWETLNGEADFGGAGSLCHGWSAMASYYYSILLSENNG